MAFPIRPRYVLAVLAVLLVIGAALFASACGSDDLEEHRRNAIVEIGDVDLALRALEFDTAFKACEVAVRTEGYGGLDGDTARAKILAECAVWLLDGR